jgi:hypothetical protein
MPDPESLPLIVKTRRTITVCLVMLSCATTLRRGVSAWVLPRVRQNSQSIRSISVIGGPGRIQQGAVGFPPFEDGRHRSVRWLATQQPDADEKDDGQSKKRKPQKKKKFKVVDEIGEKQLSKLAQAFDDMARKEGFDSSTSHFADDDTFEDEFTDDDYLDSEESYVDDDDVDGDDDDDDVDGDGDGLDISDDVMIDSSHFDLSDFSDDAIHSDNDTDDSDTDDDLFFGNDDGDMESRIAAAKKDMDSGRVSVPNELNDFATNLSRDEVKKLGFREEENPNFGDDETARKEQFKLVTDAMACSACGADFQCSNEKRPGYLPPDKFSTQVKLGKIEEMQRLREKADTNDWTAEDEIEWLLQTSGKEDRETSDNTIDIDAMAEEMDLDLVKLAQKKVICKRCHGLQNFGTVDESLRPGWTKEPLISQEKFLELLRPIREKPAVIIALVDLFDFSGSVLPELDSIAGDNPVILAANKADLLPSKMGKVRAETWVRSELEYLGIKSLANIGGAVQLVSCKTGVGLDALLDKARRLADEIDGDIYIVGAANAGKSTLLNHILRSSKKGDKEVGKRRAGNSSSRKGAVTTSPIPGTTLRFIKVDLGGGRSLYDTPGLLVPGTLTQLLTAEELKMVVPRK